MADAARNNPVEFAAAVQLANLPDGQGLPALAKMAQDTSSGSQLMATEMIAQMAGQNSDALNTLAQLVQDGKVQSGDWIHLAPLLGGDQYQLDPSGQKYSVVSSDMSPDQVNQRIMLIDTFMNYVPDGSGAYKALNQERGILAAKAGGN
jgi:HEAT repeat protein